MRIAVALLFALLALGCDPTDRPDKAPADMKTHAGSPQDGNETTVADYLTRPHGTIPPLVEDVDWKEWGPSDPDGTLTTHEKAGKVSVIRVKFVGRRQHEPRGVEDKLFYLIDHHPEPGTEDDNVPFTRVVDNPDGAAWLERAAAKKKAEDDAAMKRTH